MNSESTLLDEAVSPKLPSTVSPHLRATEVVLLSLWFGVLTGVGEVAAVALQRYRGKVFIAFSADIVWLTVLGDAIIFVFIGSLLACMTSYLTRMNGIRTFVGGLVTLGCLCVLHNFDHLHGAARFILALGVGVAAARLATSPRTGFLWDGVGRRLCSVFRPKASRPNRELDAADRPIAVDRRQALVGSAATVGGIVLGTHAWKEWKDRRVRPKLGLVATPAPNVLLIVLDTVRAQNLSLYGYGRRTSPHLDRIAKAGVCFDRAIATAPWTLPSHASMFTGRYPHELSADWLSPLDNRYPTLAEVLGRQGYATAAFVGNLVYCNRVFGLDRGFHHYEDFTPSLGQLTLSPALTRWAVDSETYRKVTGDYQLVNRKHAPAINDALLKWVGAAGQTPFFAFLNYYDAHMPYLPPHPFDGMFGRKRPPGSKVHQHHNTPENDRRLSPEELAVELDAYDGALAHVDHHVGDLLGRLDAQGILRDTVVVIVGDHGEEFSEHGVRGHGNSLYLPSLHVPLIVCDPRGGSDGRRVSEPISLRDLPATVLELLAIDAGDQIPGSSLARFWAARPDPQRTTDQAIISELTRSWDIPNRYPAAKGTMRSVVAGRHHYIRNGDGREELYDIVADPGEARNLADSLKYADVTSDLRAALATARKTG